jgi:PAS domain S-box-containing protein
MKDQSKTRAQLIEENNELHRKIRDFESSHPERKQADEGRMSSVQHYRLLIENIPSVVWVTTPEGQTVFISDNVEKVYGYTADEILSAGEELWFGRIHPEDRPQVEEAFELLFSEQRDFKIEYRIQRKDGEWIWILDSANRVEYRDRQFLAYGVFSDITDRKQAEEAYRVLVESSLQALVILQDGRIVFANPAAEVSTGYTAKELMYMENPLQTLIHPDDLPGRLERAARFDNGETVSPRTVYRVVEKNGQVHWVEAYTTRIMWMGKPAVHATFIDITERKQAEDDLRRFSQNENKRRTELEKLRDISTKMRQVDSSSNLLEVFTQEVREFCDADIAASIIFKAPNLPTIYYGPGRKGKSIQSLKEIIVANLLQAKLGNLSATIAGFGSVHTLPLQSSESTHGAMLVASYKSEAFTPDEQNMLNAIADMAGTALHRIDILETLEERVQRRTHDLVVLYNLITIISENWRLQDILELSLVLTLETVKADRSIIYLADGKEPPDLKPVIQRGFSEGFSVDSASLPNDEYAQNVFTRHKAIALENLADNPVYSKFGGLKSYAGIPILARGEVRGVFSLFANETGVFGRDEMALLASIADHLGIGIENSILWEQSHENAALEERNRLARNLHDSVSQLLYSLTLMAGSTRKMLDRNPDLDAVKNSVARLGETAHQALKEMRLLLYELRPAVLDSEGLASALQHRIETVEERLGVKVDLQANGLPELPSNIEDALYHIALEALNNIVKHAKSATAHISITSKGETVLMKISDEGIGFDTNQPHNNGSGLRNMRERVQVLGGEVVVDSQPGEGTRITVRVKLPSGSLVSD